MITSSYGLSALPAGETHTVLDTGASTLDTSPFTFLETMPKFNPIADIPNLTGKVAIVTGGNRGMGFHYTQQLADHGAKVYMAARSEEAAMKSIQRIEAENPKLKGKNNVLFISLDLGSLKASKASAERFLELESRLDILINNAALMGHPYSLTADGIEDGFAVNHLSHFVFTTTLLPLLISTSKLSDADVRVITISSMVHSNAPTGGKFLTLDEINDPLAPEKSKDGIMVQLSRYGRGKLANILMTKELQKKFEAASSPALAISLHPGGVATETAVEGVGSMIPAIRPVLQWVVTTFFMTPLDGATTGLYAATAPEVRSRAKEFAGAYLVPYGKIKQASKDGENVELAKQLWDASETISAEILSRS